MSDAGTADIILSVENLSVEFPPENADGESMDRARVIRDVSFQVRRGECLALVGESGCGKSVTSLAITRLPPASNARISGKAIFSKRGEKGGLEQIDLISAGKRELREVRSRGISYVFQDPASTLNPVLKIREQLFEALHGRLSRRDGERVIMDALRDLQLPDPGKVMSSFPHELSGGMQQRAIIAMAAISRPELIITDEPTTALDVTTQMDTLCLLDSTRKSRAMSWLFITHNLGLVSRFADRVAVMYAGEIIETGPTREVLHSPAHPYTKRLIQAVPRIDAASIEDLHGIPGRVPPPGEWPAGCAFCDRCDEARPDCATLPRALRAISPTHLTRCP